MLKKSKSRLKKFKAKLSKALGRPVRKPPSRWKRVFKWTAHITVLIVVIDALYLWSIWPNWKRYAQGLVPQGSPKSAFIKHYDADRKKYPALPPVRWLPINAQAIPTHVAFAIVLAEDSGFYKHNGLDVQAISDAVEKNIRNLEFRYGGSTLSQQTTKNLFFSPAKNPLRKWHEMILTFGMEANLSKARILHLYLNIAEFGQGIYGIEAAARYYWNRPAIQLNKRQAAELAATLPSPIKHNPMTRTPQFLYRADRIYRAINTTPRNLIIPKKT